MSNLHCFLQTAYTDICQNLYVANEQNKARHDVKSVSVPYHDGDQVWLYCMYYLLNQGIRKSLPPYDVVLDRINSANYKIQLISHLVHQGHIKHCFGTPQCPPAPAMSSPHCSVQQSPIAVTCLLYSAVLTGQATSSLGGYTSSDNSSSSLPPPSVSTATAT